MNVNVKLLTVYKTLTLAKTILVTWSMDIIAYSRKAISLLGATDSINLCILVLNLRVLTGIYRQRQQDCASRPGQSVGKIALPGKVSTHNHISYTFRRCDEEMGLSSVA